MVDVASSEDVLRKCKEGDFDLVLVNHALALKNNKISVVGKNQIVLTKSENLEELYCIFRH